MGAAGKRREEELLGQIAALQREIKERDSSIADYEGQVKTLQELVKMKQHEIAEQVKIISDLQSKIAELEKKLHSAMQSGDEATQALRRQLQEVQEAFEQFKVKSQREYAELQASLTEKGRKDLEV